MKNVCQDVAQFGASQCYLRESNILRRDENSQIRLQVQVLKCVTIPVSTLNFGTLPWSRWSSQSQGTPPSGAQGNRGRDRNLGQITAPSLSFNFPLARSWKWPLLRKARQTQDREKEEQEWETHNLDLTWIPVFGLIRNLGHEEPLSHRWVPSFQARFASELPCVVTPQKHLIPWDDSGMFHTNVTSCQILYISS